MFRIYLHAVFAALFCVLPTISAVAQETAQAGVETHDGFFLRLGLGPGRVSVTQRFEIDNVPLYEDLDWSGWGPTFELALGGTAAPGFVVGGMLIGTSVRDPDVELSGVALPTSGNDLYTVTVLGLFGQYYPDPHDGFHLQGLIGAASSRSSSGDGGGDLDDDDDFFESDDDDTRPTGFTFGAGAGYDLWIGEQWSMGAFGRILYAPLSIDRSSDGLRNELEQDVLMVQLLLTATLH